MAMGIAGFSAIGSGVYLYIQGQHLWQKAHTSASYQAPAKVEAPTQLANANHVVSDQLHQNAMAPVRESEPVKAVTATPAADLAPLVVQAKVKNASLRAGPGLEYKILGYATPELKYIVSEWNDRWFKVIISSEQEKRTAWIRNDLVRLVSIN